MDKKPFKANNFTYTITLLGLAIVGSIMLTPSVNNWLKTSFPASAEEETDNSALLQLATLPDQERESKLQEIATNSNLEGARAKYILAAEAIAKSKPDQALDWLDNLEKKSPTLAPYILLKKGQAYQLKNDQKKAVENWQQILKDYPESSVIGESLYLLGKLNPEYQEQAINLLPHHPRTQEIIRQQLKKNPKQPQLMLILAKYSPTESGMDDIRQRLMTDYASQLTPQDWEIIADGYWQMREYGKAAIAYNKTDNTPENLYRRARGGELSGQKPQAKTTYQSLIKAYPKDKMSVMALKNLAKLSNGMEAINYLDAVIANFPDDAPDALLEKANVLDRLKSASSAGKTRQLLLDKYPKSKAAAEYRWSVAQKLAEKGELLKAWQWAQPITVNNSDSSIAPKAAFWVGKWAQKLNRPDDANAAFKYVLKTQPQSYYAWRSAVKLGWNVGDFNTVRNLTPEIVKPTTLNVPPAGSELFQELYRLGQFEDAWSLFQAEISGQEKLTVAEEFTQGLLLQNQGKNLLGIKQIFDLKDKTNLEDIAQWQKLRQTPEYWYSLFPFPFEKIISKYSLDRQLNPLLVTSLIRQESRFEPAIKSSAGALGLMQVMPSTGQWISEQTKISKYSLTNPEDNVKFGTWYFDYTHKRYNNNSMLAVASYNAGPGNVSNWTQKYSLSDPDIFVEKIPFAETKNYVESVFGNYWNYLRIYNPEIPKLLEQL